LGQSFEVDWACRIDVGPYWNTFDWRFESIFLGNKTISKPLELTGKVVR